MVRRTYYLPRDVVAELDEAVAQAQAKAFVDRAPNKSAVIAAVLRAGLTALPEVIKQLRESRPPADRSPEGSRPQPNGTARTSRWQRPVAVPDSLDELRGPTTGVVHLPISVHSSGLGPADAFDLTRESDRIAMYEIVLAEAGLPDLLRFVDGAELRGLWSRLWLPPHVRSAWGKHFHEPAA